MQPFWLSVLVTHLLMTSIATAADQPSLYVISADCPAAPSLVGYDPQAVCELRLIVGNRGTGNLELTKADWRVTRVRAAVHRADPKAIWATDLTDIESIANGILPSDMPALAPGTDQRLTATFTPGKYGAFSYQVRRFGTTTWEQLVGLAVVPEPPKGDRTHSPFLAGGYFQFEKRRDYSWIPALQRLGVGWIRCNFAAVMRPDGTLDWADCDAAVMQLRQAGMRIIMDFETPPTCHVPRIDRALVTYAKGRKANLIPRREDLPLFESYAREFLTRYHDVVRGVFCRNEPWEGGSISNYHATNGYYRAWHAALYRAAQRADPTITVLANDQITNFEDIFQPDAEAMKTVTATSHHTGFRDNRGAVQSAAVGLPAWETEDWSSHADFFVIANLARKLAGGFVKSNPIDSCLDGDRDGRAVRWPTPTAQAVSVFLSMTAGMHFEREPWTTHLPQCLLFRGTGTAHRAVLIGRITAYGYDWKSGDGDMAWPQMTADGALHLTDPGKMLDVWDLSGNPLPRSADGSFHVPLTEEAYYLSSRAGAADLSAQLTAARAALEGPCLSLAMLDFTRRLSAKPPVRVRIRNLLPQADRVTVAVTPAPGWILSTASLAVDLAAGEEKIIEFPVLTNVERMDNTYTFNVIARGSNALELALTESLHACIIPRATITVDGNLAEWATIARPVLLTGGVVDPDGLSTYLFPFTNLKAKDERDTFARFATAWDDANLYIMCEVHDAKPTYRPATDGGIDALTHDAPLDYLYWQKPQFRGMVGDGLKLAIDIFRPGEKKMPWLPAAAQLKIDRRYANLAADYEYDLYAATKQELIEPYSAVVARHRERLQNPPDAAYKREWAPFEAPTIRAIGDPVPEIWRLSAPGVPSGNFYPGVPHTTPNQGLVPGAKLVVRRDGETWIYEAAIPWSELSEVKPAAGKEVRLSWYILNDGTRALSWTAGRSACRGPRQGLHPTWLNGEAIETVWGME